MVVAWLLACASAQPARVPDPALSARDFAAALQQDKPGQAYALLDPELRASLDRDRFARLWRENRTELREAGERIAHSGTATTASARLSLDDGEELVLVLEDGRWRVQG